MTHYQISVLNSRHNKAYFCCGIEPLNRYLLQQASQDIKRKVTITYVLSEPDSDKIAGYYTLSSSSIDLSAIPHTLSSKLPKYPTLPATLIGRLAIDKKFHKKGRWGVLLVDALKRSHEVSLQIASMAVIVDAKNDLAINFYKRFGFEQFTDTRDKLFLPMQTIAKMT